MAHRFLSRSWRGLHRLFARRGRHSRLVDRFNRLPLLRAFVRRSEAVPDFPTREAMWSFLAERRPHAIDYLEFGVHRGHSLLHWAQANRLPDSRFVGFDTFEGLPEDWNADYPKGHFDRGGTHPETDDPRVSFVKGLFQDTLAGFLASYQPAHPLVVHIDCDLYSSTLYCLTQLDRFLTPGTLVVFDEFGDVQHEFRALQDYLAAYRREAKVICTHDHCYTAAVEIV